MSNISKRRREGSRPKIKTMGDHKEFLNRITKTLYYGQLPNLPCLSLPVTEISCEVWSAAQRGRSLRRLRADAAAAIARQACVSPCALVLAVLYLERLNASNPDYIMATSPADLFLVSLMVGNKFLQDDGEDEEVICSEWAASGNMDLDQLKKLEVEFLNAIDWNIFVNEKCFESGLRRLERRVALRQAALRGFFTYSDLAAAGGSAAELAAALGAAMAATAAAAATLLAVLASALLLHAALPSRAPTPATPTDPAARDPSPTNATRLPWAAGAGADPPDHLGEPLSWPTDANTDAESLILPPDYLWWGGPSPPPPPALAPRCQWCPQWAAIQPPGPSWLAGGGGDGSVGALEPLVRWVRSLRLEAGGAAEYQWLNLSKLGALMVSVADR